MDTLTTAQTDALAWLLPVAAVVLLAAVTIAFAIFIGRWIDAQGNSVVDDPRERRKRDRPS
jgi:uncharacterized membrane protein